MISIIVPLYNVENYIENCLKSFETQTYKDFEIIIINDGSIDNSGNIVNNYINKSKMRIKLINQNNSGVSAARNMGIKNAQGQYMCFVDADDMVTPDYLSKMYNCINEMNSDMAICGFKFISENCDSNLCTHYDRQVSEISSNEALEKFLFRDIILGVWSLMVRSSVIRKNALSFSVNYRYSEDIEFIYKMMANCSKIVYTKSNLYLYRIRNSSVMSLVDVKRLDGYNLMKNLEMYFDKTNKNFAIKFRKYGVARWVWATMWQNVAASRNFKEFKNSIMVYMPRENMKSLLSFPKKKVLISALIYIISPYLYYIFLKIILKNNKRTHVNS